MVRVPPKLMGESRRGERSSGKSDPIDALAIARAALREGPGALPAAHLDEDAMQVKLLLDHREDLVKARSEDQCRLRWHLHDLWPELEIPAGALDRMVWQERVARKLARAEKSTRARVARELVVEIRRRTRRVQLIAETAGAERLASDAKFARLAGVAPIPASSGKRVRHRLDRGGNRQLNCPFTASPSPRDAAMPRPGSSSPKSRPRARPESKPCAASSATSRAESGGC